MPPQTDPTGRRRNIFSRHAAAFLTALLLCALGVAAYTSAASQKRMNNGSQARTRTAFTLTPGPEDKGDFKIVYRPVKDQKLAHIEKMVKDSKLFERLVDDSNKHLALPFDIPVIFKECNGKDEDPTNAFYSPEDHSITLCYGLIEKSEELFKDDEKTEKDLDEAVLGSTAWTFFHEMGHALIDVYKIVHTGKEEDAADELSTYILISGGDEGEKAALNGAEDFYREASEDKDLDEEQFADSHSLDKQRFYNVVCWVYGSNTEKYAYLTEGKDPILPEGRAEMCEDEYHRVSKAWASLLGPHTKK
jgi:hypothetical protein